MSQPAVSAGDFSVSALQTTDLAELAPVWSRTFSGERKDHRYYELISETLANPFTYGYLAIRCPRGTLRAVQPYFIVDQDLLVGMPGAVRRLAARIRAYRPRFLKSRTLMIGCAAGEGHLAGNDDFPDAAVAEVLSTHLQSVARRLGTRLIVLKEFPAAQRTLLSCFQRRGFARAPSMPNTKLSLDYRDFEDYVQRALSRRGRSDLRRKFRARDRAGDVRMIVTDDVDALADEIHALYRQTFSRSNMSFEELSPDYFRALSRRMKDKARFFLWLRGNSLVAFAFCMVKDEEIFAEYLGMDYSVALELHLYHNIFRDVVSWAIGNGYRWFRSSGLNYATKLTTRQRLDPIDLYVRHTSPLVNALLKLALPWLAPVRYDKVLRRFPNYRELW